MLKVIINDLTDNYNQKNVYDEKESQLEYYEYDHSNKEDDLLFQFRH